MTKRFPLEYQAVPNAWSCLPTSFAIAMGWPLKRLLDAIGHDGSAKVHEGVSDPYCRRAFHIQEIIDVMFENGWWVCHHEMFRSIETMPGLPFDIPIKKLPFFLMRASGVLIGSSGPPHCLKLHAVAWDHYSRMIIDCRGFKREFDLADLRADIAISSTDFTASEFYSIGLRN